MRTPDASPSARPPAVWTYVFWATALATALPLLTLRYLPFTDVPEHVAVIATLARLLPGGGGAPPYELALGHSQYLLYDAAGALVARVVGDAVIANQLLFAAVAVLWAVAARSLLRAMGRDERLAIFATMVFWNRATVVGFEPYIASIALAMFALAIVVRVLRAGEGERLWPRAVGLGVLAVAVFYTHASSYLLFAFTAAALLGAMVLRDRSVMRRALAVAAALAPSAVAAAAWWRVGSLTEAGAPSGVDRMPLGMSVGAMPIWTFDVWQTHVDELCAATWWLAYALVVVSSWRKPRAAGDARSLRWIAWVPFACAAAVYLTTPFRIGGASMLNVRLAPIITLFALLGLELRRDRAGTIAVGMAAMAAIVTGGNAVYEMRYIASEKLGDFEVVLAAMKPGTSVVSINFERSSRHAVFWPYAFMGAYHRARGGTIASYSFTELPHWPLHYARGFAPPDHGALWSFRPCEYRYRQDGAFYDYVLVQGKMNPFDGRQGTLGPTFSPIAHAGSFTLYDKTGGPPADTPQGEADRGPCPAQPQVSTY